MSKKDRVLPKLSLRQWVLTIIILCMSAWSAPAETLAQQATSAASDMTEPSTLWSFGGARSKETPYLVLGMADRGDTPFHGLGTAGSEATNPPAENALARRDNPATSMNRTDKVGADASIFLNSFRFEHWARSPRKSYRKTRSTRLFYMRIPAELSCARTTISE